MFPPFPEDKAKNILKLVFEKIRSKEIYFEQITQESKERKNQGVMIGVLVCKNESGNEITIITNSGIAKNLATNDPNFTVAPPIVSAKQIEDALSENDVRIHELSKQKSSEASRQLKELCAQSLKKVHNLYSFHCADGKVKNLKEICIEYNNGKLPPTGIGDCCAPKLLNYAFKNNLQPISMAESYFQNNESSGTEPSELVLTPPCDSRCGILLPAMLGLRILYRDDFIIIVNKQSGILSVPGRIEKDCIVNRVKKLFPNCIEQPAVHRLDMETSGLLVLAFTKEAHRNLNKQFEEGKVKKEYIALLDGILAKKGIPQKGIMELYFRLDVENRPHQIWDSENGKKAITEWTILQVEKYHAPDNSIRNSTRVLFTPHTGRTHQLRLASSDPHGFGIPIIGDTLYGKCDKGERLMLHAYHISFEHPITGEQMDFTCESEF